MITPPDQNSVVENTSGDVRLVFSDRSGGRIEARARYGRIESELQGLVVADDGTTASGIVNRVNRPTIQVVSGANVYVSAGAATKKP